MKRYNLLFFFLIIHCRFLTLVRGQWTVSSSTNYVLYRNNGGSYTFTQANNICQQQLGTELATIIREEESDEISALRNALGGVYTQRCNDFSGQNQWYTYGCWIGLYKSNDEWYFVESSDIPFNYEIWGTNQPSGDGSCVTDHCLGSANGWNDIPCSNTFECFVCNQAPPTAAPVPTPEPVAPTPSPTPSTPGPTPSTDAPTPATDAPSAVTDAPTAGTDAPTRATDAPTNVTPGPTSVTEPPTASTDTPTFVTQPPTLGPSDIPSVEPTAMPTVAPTGATEEPTETSKTPTSSPTPAPTAPTGEPSGQTDPPTVNSVNTQEPSEFPTEQTNVVPTDGNEGIQTSQETVGNTASSGTDTEPDVMDSLDESDESDGSGSIVTTPVSEDNLGSTATQSDSGATAAIVAGVCSVLFVCMLAAVFFFFRSRKKREEKIKKDFQGGIMKAKPGTLKVASITSVGSVTPTTPGGDMDGWMTEGSEEGRGEHQITGAVTPLPRVASNVKITASDDQNYFTDQEEDDMKQEVVVTPGGNDADGRESDSSSETELDLIRDQVLRNTGVNTIALPEQANTSTNNNNVGERSGVTAGGGGDGSRADEEEMNVAVANLMIENENKQLNKVRNQSDVDVKKFGNLLSDGKMVNDLVIDDIVDEMNDEANGIVNINQTNGGAPQGEGNAAYHHTPM